MKLNKKHLKQHLTPEAYKALPKTLDIPDKALSDIDDQILLEYKKQQLLALQIQNEWYGVENPTTHNEDCVKINESKSDK